MLTPQAAFTDVSPQDADGLAIVAQRLFAELAWLDRTFAAMIAAARADPRADIALKVNRDAHRSAAILYRTPGVTITLSRTAAAGVQAGAEAPTIICSGKLAVTRYLRSGGATLTRWRAAPLPVPLTAGAIGPACRIGDRALRDGDIVRHDGRAGAQVLVGATRAVVALTATIDAGADPVAREYDRATCRFLRMATNDEGAARAQLLLSLLRAAGRPDRDAFDAATRDDAFFLRWSALREWLATDWRGAWPRLREMAAEDPHPEVRAAAAATIDRLTLKAA
jgi:hypothetical protein